MAFPNPLYQVVEDTLTAATEAHTRCQYREAETHYRAALEAAPGHPRANQYLGVLLFQTGRVTEGLACLELAQVATPDDAELLTNLGNAYRECNLLDKSHQALGQAVALRPQSALAHLNLACTLLGLGDVESARREYTHALMLDPSSLEARSSLALCSLYRDETAGDAASIALEAWYGPPPSPPTRPDRPLKTIGYVSGDFAEHPVGFFLEPVLRAHDRERYRIVLFPNQTARDAHTSTLCWLADETRWIVGQTDQEAVETVHRSQVDVLVDLSGHTSKNRLGLFARRPCPVQFTWLGFPGTTGLPVFNGLVADGRLVPTGSDATFSEPVCRLPRTFLCAPFDRIPQPSPTAPATQNGAVTFGCFNNVPKLSRRALGLFSRILAESHGSRLVLKCPSYTSESARERLLRVLTSNCVHPSRVAFMGPCSRDDHWAAFAEVDVLLDSMPYTGATTTVESLAMGVPVVTRAGEGYSQRMSASILAAAGCDAWVCEDDHAYVATAVGLARQVLGEGFDRTGLRQRAESSPLGDRARFTSDLERAFEDAWEGTPTA